MKYRVIKYENGTYGLHEMFRNRPFIRPIVVADSVAEILADIQNMAQAVEIGGFYKEPANGYARMAEGDE